MGIGIDRKVASFLEQEIIGSNFDLAIVDNGDVIGLKTMRIIKLNARKCINFNLDNPFVTRDGSRWRLHLTTIKHYDLIIYPRISSVHEAYRMGAKKAARIFQMADELLHRPIMKYNEKLKERKGHIVFIGSWMQGRGEFMMTLLEHGLEITIYGPRWEKAPEYKYLKHCTVARWIGDEEYVRLISCADIAIGLTSEQNLDLHTTRSIEIPAIGTLLCAKRSADHMLLYEDGVEAIFFDTADDCAHKCLELLSKRALLAKIAENGHERCKRNGNYNETVLKSIVDQIYES